MTHELIIIGGGPAGLAAAAFAVRKRMDALIISRGLGGRTRRRLTLPWIDDYQLLIGEETVQRFRAQLDYLDFMRVRASAQRIERLDKGFRVHISDDQHYDTATVILAMGAKGEYMNIPGEKEFEMKGLCYGAMTYAPLMVDRNVIVVGDELMALRAVAEISRIATQVVLVAETEGELDSPVGQKVLSLENVVIKRGFKPVEVKGDEYARSMVISQAGRHQEIFADAIFVEKRLVPNTDLAAGMVEMDGCGFIQVDARNRTSLPGLYAAGDITNSSSFQVLMGLGDGEKAALSAYDFLLGVQVAPCA